jgi:phosphate starvation-inducible protein PhoH and related proteins
VDEKSTKELHLPKQHRQKASYSSNSNSNSNSNKNNANNITQLHSYLDQTVKKKSVQIIPRNANQEAYLELLMDESCSIVIATGPAGTGKTLLAMQTAIKALKERRIGKIVVTRPAVGVEDEKHGFLPGSLTQKMEPWTKPLFDVLHEYYTPRDTQNMILDEIIEICPLAFMRGRTFKDAYIIADEMQNATPNQMKMLLTRIGDGARILVTGDVKQTDRKVGDNGLLDFRKLLKQFNNSEYVSNIEFTMRDIERHPAVEEVLKIYGDD